MELAIYQSLSSLNDRCLSPWEIKKGKLCKVYAFPDFVQAFGFMASVALYAEKEDHHPEWTNIYNHVKVQLTTHSADGVTTKDFALAHKMEALYSARSPHLRIPE